MTLKLKLKNEEEEKFCPEIGEAFIWRNLLDVENGKTSWSGPCIRIPHPGRYSGDSDVKLCFVNKAFVFSLFTRTYNLEFRKVDVVLDVET
jgi:hypothetical protein